MIVDSSAIIAILRDEPEKQAFVAALFASGGGSISAGSWIEIAAVVARRYPMIHPDRAEDIRQALNITIEQVSAAQARIGATAYRRYGLGSQHPARLNFGDCFSYALAADSGRPLLFKGDDFVHTDIVPALR